jgi:hypothetical protein
VARAELRPPRLEPRKADLDTHFFDAFSRRLSTIADRRGLLRGGVAAALAGSFMQVGGQETSTACRAVGKPCTKAKQCCTGQCRKDKCKPCPDGGEVIDGFCVISFGSLGTGDGQVNSPYFLADDGKGHVYVTDYGNHRVQKFKGNGTLLRKWGTLGTDNGQFPGPAGILCDGAGRVYVADQANHRIQVFDEVGRFLAIWGTEGTGNGQFDGPIGLAFDAAGTSSSPTNSSTGCSG